MGVVLVTSATQPNARFLFYSSWLVLLLHPSLNFWSCARDPQLFIATCAYLPGRGGRYHQREYWREQMNAVHAWQSGYIPVAAVARE